MAIDYGGADLHLAKKGFDYITDATLPRHLWSTVQYVTNPKSFNVENHILQSQLSLPTQYWQSANTTVHYG